MGNWTPEDLKKEYDLLEMEEKEIAPVGKRLENIRDRMKELIRECSNKFGINIDDVKVDYSRNVITREPQEFVVLSQAEYQELLKYKNKIEFARTKIGRQPTKVEEDGRKCSDKV